MVGTTGIEPVTPTMSKQCVDGNYSKIPGNRTQNAHFRSRLSHGNDGHFLGLERHISGGKSPLASPGNATGRALAKAAAIRRPRNDTAAPSATNVGMKSHAKHAEGGWYSRSEEADDYDAVVARLNDRWRVIVCGADIQWILQRRRGQRRGRARWEGRSYCRTKEAITRLSRRFAHPIDPVAAAIMAALPDCIGNTTINSSE
jgi:hypothetical protein